MDIRERYIASGEVFSGGMGDVLSCRDSHLDRDVVIKFLQAGIEQRRFMDEQLALMQLRSKHVVQLYDLVISDGKQGLVLEYIEGDDLSNLEYSAQGVDIFVSDLWQVACGLVDIHLNNIIHRDLKPNNIRKNSDGVVKIFDFGLAREGNCAETIGAKGTFAFMAPELWGEGSTQFSQAVDVYAFGVTALYMYCRKIPVELGSKPPQSYSVGGEVTNLLSGVDPKIVEIIERCLAYSPDDRPLINEVEECLRRYLLKDRHRGYSVINGVLKYVDKDKRSTRIGLQGQQVYIAIEYDGYDFLVSEVAGDVKVNNLVSKVGDVLPNSSVFTFQVNMRNRAFVTFDISNPEVII